MALAWPRRDAAPAEAAAPGLSPAAASERRAGRRCRPLVSPLTLRILAVNVLALAMLVGGLLYLGRYQDRLIEAELDALRVEGRIFAGALGEGAVAREGEEEGALSPEQARLMIRRLVETTETRTRLYGIDGTLLADSRQLMGTDGVIQVERLPAPDETPSLGEWLVDTYDRLVTALLPRRRDLPVYGEHRLQMDAQRRDIARALAGEPASAVWSTAQGQLVLTVAVPVQRFKQVLGAVLLSRSGGEIDRAVRQVRLDILKIFAVALGVTVLLSFYLAGAIGRPIRRLAQAADQVRRGHGRHTAIPDFTGRHDEIGDLSRALRDMTEALWARLDAIERFAADVSHEIKNPLTSLRSAVETAARVTDPSRRARLMEIIEDDVRRLDRLISDISDASRLDAELSRASVEPVDLRRVLRMLADMHEDMRSGEAEAAPRLALDLPEGGDLTVQGLEGRLVQVLRNLIANALSFSPHGGTVTLGARDLGDRVAITVADEGPGIPEGKLEAIFDRFYTERPRGEKFGTHSGLGLSISRQIVEAHGGTIRAENRRAQDGGIAGALFTITLPRS
ncbi:stimulus-sensing domain-containing protein [Arenibaculum pallidiluteum]|uniref:stimulus-sensing domain-containing protein n=1 Tax=Arenibaculum pallidiluteum TaxID=2812559 RepID=UPI001A97A54F|nr:stimulus-sensing domain-containing protein [Arenibaculum pallidiluteum]